MRVVTLMLLSLATLAGCTSEPPASSSDDDTGGTIIGEGNSSSDGTTRPDDIIDEAPPKPTLEVLREQVYVLMKAWDGGDWMCTGALVSSTRVVTAAHCLDPGEFESFVIVAPLAQGKPRVNASGPQLMSYDYEEVEEPDVGFLTLDEPIELAAYAKLTDVSGAVEGGKALAVTTVVRTEEDFEAPFKAIDTLKLRDTTDTSYAFGFGVDLFSRGGDSGAGVYLFEDGEATHELVAVCRQPDPDSDTDHLTRIDGKVLAWFADHPEE